MLPTNLRSTYAGIYRGELNDFVTWLKTTADALGFVSKQPPKAFKQPKLQKPHAPSGSTSAPPPPTSPPIFIVPTTDYTAMASKIAECGRIPMRIIHLLDRIIEIRGRWSEKFRDRLPESAARKRADGLHLSYLGVLKKIRSILHAAPGLENPTEDSAGENPFAASEEAAEASWQSQRATNPATSDKIQEPTATSTPTRDRNLYRTGMETKPSEGQATRYMAEMNENIAEDFFAIQLMLDDLNDLRNEVIRTWEAFKGKRIQLSTASLITNVAVDLARALEEECSGALDRLGGIAKVFHTLMEGECRANGASMRLKMRKTDEFNMNYVGYANEIFLVPWVQLTFFACEIAEKKITYVPESATSYDPTSDRSKKTSRQQYEEDDAILRQFLPQVMLLVSNLCSLPQEDELVRAIRLLHEAGPLALHARMLWMVFALQMYVEIHNVLRGKADIGWQYLHPFAASTTKAIQDIQALHNPWDIGLFSKAHEEFGNRMQALEQTFFFQILEDPLREANEVAFKNDRANTTSPYYFWRIHPWGCGIWYYYMREQLYDLGVSLANYSGSILYSGHLYNAVRSEKYLRSVHVDADLLLSIRADEFIEKATDADGYLRCFMKSMGDAAKLPEAIGFRNAGNTSSAAEPADPLMDYVRQYEESQRATSAAAIQRRLPQTLRWMAHANATFGRRFQHGDLSFKEEDIEDIRFRWDQARANDTVAVTEHLSVLRWCLEDEQLELNFDHLSLHEFCWKLLRKIRARCGEDVEEIFGEKYIVGDRELPFLIGYILNAFADEPPGPFWRGRRKLGGPKPALLLKAANVLQDAIEEDMSKEEQSFEQVLKNINFPRWFRGPFLRQSDLERRARRQEVGEPEFECDSDSSHTLSEGRFEPGPSGTASQPQNQPQPVAEAQPKDEEEPKIEAKPKSETIVEKKAKPKTNTQLRREARAKSKAEAKNKAQAKTEGEIKSEVQQGSEAQPKSAAQSKGKAKAQDEVPIADETQTKSEIRPESKPQPANEPQPKIEAQPASEAQPPSEAQPETKPQSASDPESESEPLSGDEIHATPHSQAQPGWLSMSQPQSPTVPAAELEPRRQSDP